MKKIAINFSIGKMFKMKYVSYNKISPNAVTHLRGHDNQSQNNLSMEKQKSTRVGSEEQKTSDRVNARLCDVAITHRFLCERGAKWLRNTGNWKFKSQYVLVEFVSSCRENPDLFGLRGSKNICVEVKVSRADFKRDIKKPHRQTAGIGATRYYLCPKGMIKPDEISNGWGLMEYNSEHDMIEVIKESEYFHIRDYESEENLMYSVIRRLAGTPKVLDFRNVT